MKREYWKNLTLKQKEELAAEVVTSSGYLRQVFMYDRSTGAGMARTLAEKTGIGAHEFCPEAFSSSDVLSFNIKQNQCANHV